MPCKVVLEPVRSADTLGEAVTQAERAEAARLAPPARRDEYLTWRAVVRRCLGCGVGISYDAVGAPTVDTPDIYISVAHSAGMTAVAIDSGRCGVDIEALDRDFSKGVRRILSARELSLSGRDCWPAAAWCAKEAMYKYYGRRGVNMAREMVLDRVDSEVHRIEAHMQGEDSCTVLIHRTGGYIVAAISRNDIEIVVPAE